MITEEVGTLFKDNLSLTPLMVQDPSIFFSQFEDARLKIINKFGNNSGYDTKKAIIIQRKTKPIKDEESKLQDS